MRRFLPACLLPLPSNPALFPVGRARRRPLRANAPFRNAAADQCQCGRRPPVRSHARMCLLVPSPPPPPPLNRSGPGPPCRPLPQIRGWAAGWPAPLPMSSQPSRTSTGPPVPPKEKRGGRRAPIRPPRSAPLPLPPPCSTQSAGRPTHPPGLPAPTEPGPPSHAGHYPATPRSPPNTSSPRRRRRRPESGWGRPGGGFTSILRPDSPLPTRVQYGTERKRRDQSSRDALSARRLPDLGGVS